MPHCRLLPASDIIFVIGTWSERTMAHDGSGGSTNVHRKTLAPDHNSNYQLRE